MRERHPLTPRASEFAALQKPQDLSELLWLVDEHAPRSVLEIGTYAGGTLYCLCRLAQPDATITSIDNPWAGSAGDTQTNGPTRCRSQLDLLFIDGDHTYEGVKSDFEMYSPLVREGGMIAFHDILDHNPDTGCEVSTYWNEIKDDYPHVELAVAPYRWGGIGVVWKR